MSSMVFQRKLLALGYPIRDTFDIKNQLAFRNLIVFLEDRCITIYKIEERAALRDVQSDKWNAVFQKYLDDMDCPIKGAGDSSILDWLLGVAVGYKYGDQTEIKEGCRYSEMTAVAFKQKLEKISASVDNPLDNIDVESDDFKEGVRRLAELLHVPSHPDHKQVIKACCLLIEEKLSKDEIEKAKAISGKVKKEFIVPGDISTGLKLSDGALKEVAMILRLLHVHQLRDLQNDINAAIVSVQEITADPKTDERLGKVGF